jgi:hypothetical protein
MARKKKKQDWLNLPTDWMFHEPIDFEHKKYVLLDFLKKCENKLDEFKIYPTFIELSLHLANTQTLIKNNNILITKKSLVTLDDEIMIKDLEYKQQPTYNNELDDEIKKIIKYSAPKFFDYFNLAKSIWTMCFDSVELNFVKNRVNLNKIKGFVIYNDTYSNINYVWEFFLNKVNKQKNDYKIHFNSIYSGNTEELNITQIISNYTKTFSKLSEKELLSLPIIEVSTKQNFPFDETLVPIFKRKIMSNIMQSVKLKQTHNT